MVLSSSVESFVISLLWKLVLYCELNSIIIQYIILSNSFLEYLILTGQSLCLDIS